MSLNIQELGDLKFNKTKDVGHHLKPNEGDLCWCRAGLVLAWALEQSLFCKDSECCSITMATMVVTADLTQRADPQRTRTGPRWLVLPSLAQGHPSLRDGWTAGWWWWWWWLFGDVELWLTPPNALNVGIPQVDEHRAVDVNKLPNHFGYCFSFSFLLYHVLWSRNDESFSVSVCNITATLTQVKYANQEPQNMRAVNIHNKR